MFEGKTESITTKPPQELLDRVTRERPIGNNTVHEIKKTGSTLHLIEDKNKQVIVRNGEIPESSMAVWEFASGYAQEFLPDEVRKKLFGIWDRVQVVPFLQRKEQPRVYYRNGQASAYSEFAGYDTEYLANLWGLEDVYLEYKLVQDPHFYREPRWVDSMAYHLTKDIVNAIPEFGNNGELMELLEAYWFEFTRLNSDKIGAADLLAAKELRRQDMDDDDNYGSSMKLIEIGHLITNLIREKLQELSAHPEYTSEWKGNNGKELLLFLLHLHQTSVQQKILWWLGIANGHLHLKNSVSRFVENNQESKSQLETHIIDFDNSRISAQKLADNDEIYSLVDVEKVRTRVKDNTININLRLLFTMYLPLSEWDDEVFQLLSKNADKQIVKQIVKLINLRASRDTTSPQQFEKFAHFTFQFEKNISKSDFDMRFYDTVSMVRQNLTLVESAPTFQIVSEYIKGGFDAIETSSLDEDKQLLLLSVIFFNYQKNRRINPMVSRPEFEWAFSFVEKTDQVGLHAIELIENFLNDYHEHLIVEIFTEASKEDGPSMHIAKRLMAFVCMRTSAPRTKIIQRGFFNKLYNAGQLQFALRLMDFDKMPRDKAEIAYKSVKDAIEWLGSGNQGMFEDLVSLLPHGL